MDFSCGDDGVKDGGKGDGGAAGGGGGGGGKGEGGEEEGEGNPLARVRPFLPQSAAVGQEIVMVLSALAKMRGGRSPTEAEVEMMAEARKQLAEVVCESRVPKDLVAREVIAALIEDLGLSGLVKEASQGNGTATAGSSIRMTVAEFQAWKAQPQILSDA